MSHHDKSPVELADGMATDLAIALTLLRLTPTVPGTLDRSLEMIGRNKDTSCLMAFDGLARLKTAQTPNFFNPVAEAFAQVAERTIELQATAESPRVLVPISKSMEPENMRPNRAISTLMLSANFASFNPQGNTHLHDRLITGLERLYDAHGGEIASAPPLPSLRRVITSQFSDKFGIGHEINGLNKQEAGFIAQGFTPLRQSAVKFVQDNRGAFK